MDRKELLNYAIKGLGIEIAEKELKISKGYNIIDRINKREKVNTTKTITEILETIEKYRQERDELQQKRDDLLFDEMMADDDRNVIAEMQLDDYITAGEQRAREIEQRENDNE